MLILSQQVTCGMQDWLCQLFNIPSSEIYIRSWMSSAKQLISFFVPVVV